MMPIYEADSCFLKLVYIYAELVYELVYGWCMAGVWLVHDDGYAEKDLIGF